MSTQNKLKEESIQNVLRNIDQVREGSARGETPSLVDMSNQAHELENAVNAVVGIDPRTQQSKPQKPDR